MLERLARLSPAAEFQACCDKGGGRMRKLKLSTALNLDKNLWGRGRLFRIHNFSMSIHARQMVQMTLIRSLPRHDRLR